jgi:hypothetical protein
LIIKNIRKNTHKVVDKYELQLYNKKMRNFIIYILLFLSPLLSYADIIDDIILRKSWNNWSLPFTLIIEDNDFKVFYEGSGYHPTIMAYQFNDNILRFIVKNSYFGQEVEIPDEIFESKYYLLEIKYRNNDIILEYNEIKIFNLNNYTITNGTIDNDNVNIRLSPSVSGQKHTRQLFKNNTVKVISIENKSKVNNIIDYWYGIEIDNRIVWVYGYYCDFSRNINIENIRNKR